MNNEILLDSRTVPRHIEIQNSGVVRVSECNVEWIVIELCRSDIQVVVEVEDDSFIRNLTVLSYVPRTLFFLKSNRNAILKTEEFVMTTMGLFAITSLNIQNRLSVQSDENNVNSCLFFRHDRNLPLKRTFENFQLREYIKYPGIYGMVHSRCSIPQRVFENLFRRLYNVAKKPAQTLVCSICLVNEADAVMFPCKHLYCCFHCFNLPEVRHSPCGICRSKVEYGIQVYECAAREQP